MVERIEEAVTTFQGFVSWDELMTMPACQFREWWLKDGGTGLAINMKTKQIRNATHPTTESAVINASAKSG